ncbi:DNA excision repair protein ERCC-8 [Elysia marginata]|uniref:DNA excision repair protein ERCC-8 n=1 Tax=Elysia marginata TaxID=1093978 RepID=A0AAV4IZ81_9GAST|nr:DNA excision repair protein ERCC-8 [Elysia marginata]
MKTLNFGLHHKPRSSSSIIHGIASQRSGLVASLQLQRAINSFFIKQLQLSRHKDVETTNSGAVNDLDVDNTEQRYLLSGCSDGSIAVHDLQQLYEDEHNSGALDTLTYKLVCTVSAGNRNAHKRSIETVQWYPLDTGIFTSSGTDRILKIWDANRLQTAEEYSFSGIVHCHHMSPVATKHNLVAVGTDSSVVKLVDPRAGSATHCLRGHREGAVRAVRWSNKNEFILATGGWIKRVCLIWSYLKEKSYLRKLLLKVNPFMMFFDD